MQSASLVLLSNQQMLDRAMEVVANNVANSSTSGFKREGIQFSTLLEHSPDGQSTAYAVDRATYRDTSNGPIESTNNPLDVAIQGQGYFEVQTPQGIRYTRGGAFQMNADGELVTLSGYPVLDDGGAPLDIPATTTEINISGDGFISVRADNGTNLQQIGKINLVDFANEQQVVPEGAGLYNTTQAPAPAQDSAIVQGAIENSNVKPVLEMTHMIEIQRAYEQTVNLLSQENTRLTDAITTLSKTTA